MAVILSESEKSFPSDAEEQRDQLRRIDLVNQVTIAIVLAGFMMMSLQLFEGQIIRALLVFTLCVLVGISPWLLRLTSSPTFAGNWIVFHSYCFLSHNIYLTGGVFTAAYAWVLALPIIATMLGKKNSGIIWTFLVVLLPVIFYSLKKSGYEFPVSDIQQDYSINNVIALILLSCVLAYAAIRYELYNDESKAYIRSLTIRDELTKLHNRRGFLTLADLKLKEAMRDRKLFALVYVDLDQFKSINDNHGHAEGDEVLIETANILRDSFRESDVIARIGGDEFIVAAVFSSKEDADTIFSRLDNAAAKYRSQSTKPYELRFSHGVVFAKDHATRSLSELMSKADREMYLRKKQGEA